MCYRCSLPKILQQQETCCHILTTINYLQGWVVWQLISPPHPPFSWKVSVTSFPCKPFLKRDKVACMHAHIHTTHTHRTAKVHYSGYTQVNDFSLYKHANEKKWDQCFQHFEPCIRYGLPLSWASLAKASSGKTIVNENVCDTIM